MYVLNYLFQESLHNSAAVLGSPVCLCNTTHTHSYTFANAILCMENDLNLLHTCPWHHFSTGEKHSAFKPFLITQARLKIPMIASTVLKGKCYFIKLALTKLHVWTEDKHFLFFLKLRPGPTLIETRHSIIMHTEWRPWRRAWKPCDCDKKKIIMQ